MSSKQQYGAGDTGEETNSIHTAAASEDDERSISYSASNPQQPLTPNTSRKTFDGHFSIPKEPWVPAPGKTTKVRSHSSISTENRLERSEFGKLGSVNVPVTKSAGNFEDPSFSRSSKHEPARMKGRSPRGRKKNRGYSLDERKMSGFTLESKDSLIDVTACLNKRREEVFHLWEQNVLKCDAVLLNEFEKANTFAIEAAKDVNELRSYIDNLKKKPGKISEGETRDLEFLRNRILSTLQLFEDSHEYIQQNLTKSRQSSRSRGLDEIHESNEHARDVAPAKSKSKVSFPEETPLTDLPVAAKKSSSSIIHLKTKNTSFSEGDTDFEIEFEDFDEKILNTVEEDDDEENRNGNKQHSPRKFQRSHGMKSKSRSKSSSVGKERNGPTITVETIYYREKIRGLHKKLMQQEMKYDELRQELKRIESQNDYDVKLLKANMKAQMDELVHVPEMLEFTEDRLNESLHAKFAIEANLQMKVNDFNNMKAEVKRLTSELRASHSKLNAAEKKNETMAEKMEKMENENKQLRTELWNQSKVFQRLEQNRNNNIEPKSQTVVESHGKEKDNHKLFLLEDKINELENELEKAIRETHALKRAKNQITSRLQGRIDELMDTLEATRVKNRSLLNQMNVVKSRYFQLFVPQSDKNSKNIFPEITKVIADSKQEEENEEFAESS